MKTSIINDIKKIFDNHHVIINWDDFFHIWKLSVLRMSSEEIENVLIESGYHPINHPHKNLYITFLPTNKAIERITK